MAELKESPSQTAGPYVHIGCTPNVTGITTVLPADPGSVMITGPAEGEQITITGKVFDGNGDPLLDALVEIWQADAAGLYPSPAEERGKADAYFTGWGRQAVDLEDGTFTFRTIKPGAIVDGTLHQAPHITFWIVARGINVGLHTRMYFPQEQEANAADPLLGAVPAVRRNTLIAAQAGPDTYRFDIRLQGHAETVFFDI